MRRVLDVAVIQLKHVSGTDCAHPRLKRRCGRQIHVGYVVERGLLKVLLLLLLLEEIELEFFFEVAFLLLLL